MRFGGGLRSFSIQDVGGNAAALKIYMSIALMAPYRAKPPAIHAGKASISYDEFENMTGLSRSLIPRGLAILSTEGLVEVVGSQKTHAYRLIGYDDDSLGWGKIPRDYLRGGRVHPQGRLAAIGHRHPVDLNALKIYLALVAFRDGTSGYSLLSYDKIVEHTGVHRSRIRPALTSLFDAQLVSVDPMADYAVGASTSNRYALLGLSRRQPPTGTSLSRTAPMLPTTHVRTDHGAD
jgi:DNA-binding transcriptional ArsR family regulator